MSPLPLGYTAPLMSATKVRIFFEISTSCEEIEDRADKLSLANRRRLAHLITVIQAESAATFAISFPCFIGVQ